MIVMVEPKKQTDWSRFERAVDIALKTPAKHKPAIRKSKKKTTQKKAR